MAFENMISSVTVIISPQKESLVKYLSKWKDRFYIRFIYFDDRNFEWAGSILSSEPDFDDYNIVFLPDTFLEGRADSPVLPSYQSAFETNDIVFGVMSEHDPDVLRNLGAVYVEPEGTITRFCDKPHDNAELYNAFWGTFGFRKSFGRPLLEWMTQSIQRKPVAVQDLQARISGFPLNHYRDLGVWPNLHDFVNRLIENDGTFPEFH